MELCEEICWTSQAVSVTPIRALVVCFHGLGKQSHSGIMKTHELAWAEQGALVAKPLCGPWSFMNDGTVRFIDDLIDAIRRTHALDPEVPLILCGGSMGGAAVLLYAAFGKHAPARCIVLEPVANFPLELEGSPRARRYAEVAYGYDAYRSQLEARSPLNLVDSYPHVPYLMAHGPNDPTLHGKETRRLAESMQAAGLDVEYHDYPHFGHQQDFPLDLVLRMVSFVDKAMAAAPSRT